MPPPAPLAASVDASSESSSPPMAVAAPPAEAQARALPAVDSSRSQLEQRVEEFVSTLKPILTTMIRVSSTFELGKKKEFQGERDVIRTQLLNAADAFFEPQDRVIAVESRERERAKHRKHVVAEFISTEEDYLKDLQLLDSVWHVEMKKAGVLSPQEIQVVFGNVRQLVALSQEICDCLKANKSLPEADQRVGEVFKKRIPFIRIYMEYAYSQVQATEILQNANKFSKFRDFVDKTKFGVAALRNLDVQAFLIKPTQRITKYPLLLKDLIKHTPEDHADYLNLVEALDGMHRVLEEINKRTRECQTVALLNRFMPTFVWTSEPPVDIFKSQSVIIKEGKIPVTLSKSDGSQEKGTVALLFDNFFLVGKAVKDCVREVFSSTTTSLTIQEDNAVPGTISLTSSQTLVEIALHCSGEAEVSLWMSAINEALARSKNAHPLVFADASRRDTGRRDSKHKPKKGSKSRSGDWSDGSWTSSTPPLQKSADASPPVGPAAASAAAIANAAATASAAAAVDMSQSEGEQSGSERPREKKLKTKRPSGFMSLFQSFRDDPQQVHRRIKSASVGDITCARQILSPAPPQYSEVPQTTPVAAAGSADSSPVRTPLSDRGPMPVKPAEPPSPLYTKQMMGRLSTSSLDHVPSTSGFPRRSYSMTNLEATLNGECQEKILVLPLIAQDSVCVAPTDRAKPFQERLWVGIGKPSMVRDAVRRAYHTSVVPDGANS
eukprot:m51a1_g11698 putative domain containing protein (723) ;mRNA; f:31715-34657